MEFLKLLEDAKSRVSLNCKQYHTHSALKGCFIPKEGETEDVVTICKLGEHINFLEFSILEFITTVKN